MTESEETKIILKIGKDTQKVSYLMRFFDRWRHYTTTYPDFILRGRFPNDLRDVEQHTADLDTLVRYFLNTSTRQRIIRYGVKKSEVVIFMRGRVHQAWWVAFIRAMHCALSTKRHTPLEVVFGSGFKETVVKLRRQSYANRPKKLRYKRKR